MDQAKDRGVFRVLPGARESADPVVGGHATEGRSAPAPLPPARERRASRGLAAIVARIREDARVEPGRYLEECEVPGGGE